MIIEVYEAPESASAEAINSPISNTTGELPEQEPELNLGDLLGSFDSQEEAIAFIQEQVSSQNQQMTKSEFSAFNAYTHVGLLTITIQNENQSTHQKKYYLVTDEGY